MKDFSFTLIYKLADATNQGADLFENLEAHGCTDAYGGIDDREKLSLEFTVNASSMSEAVSMARSEVHNFSADAKFKELKCAVEEMA